MAAPTNLVIGGMEVSADIRDIVGLVSAVVHSNERDNFLSSDELASILHAEELDPLRHVRGGHHVHLLLLIVDTDVTLTGGIHFRLLFVLVRLARVVDVRDVHIVLLSIAARRDWEHERERTDSHTNQTQKQKQ
jgi:hypothetical protein